MTHRYVYTVVHNADRIYDTWQQRVMKPAECVAIMNELQQRLDDEDEESEDGDS